MTISLISLQEAISGLPDPNKWQSSPYIVSFSLTYGRIKDTTMTPVIHQLIFNKVKNINNKQFINQNPDEFHWELDISKL